MATERGRDLKLKSWPIYLYVPNLIGYARILANIVAFGECFANKKLFTALYFVSFVCDELDGRFARMLNQASTFGAVLDMVTDRVLYLILYELAESPSDSVVKVFMAALNQKSPLMLLGLLALPGWAIKQIVNVVQIKTAADTCVLYDLNRSQRP